MSRVSRSWLPLFATVALLGASGCGLRRPNTVPPRMIEPQLFDPSMPDSAKQVAKTADAAPIRVLNAQALGHIGRRVLHELPDGELTEDPIWQWSSTPNHYLDQALHIEVTSNPNLRLVDTANAPAVGATLLVWELESAGETRLVGTVEFQITGKDRAIHSQIVRASEPVTGELPGDLASVAGRLMRHLATEGLANVPSQR
jgi:hypothetical protein